MQRENKMGTMPVGRLLITMSLPMIISMLVQALYNIVDSMFVSQISENALTAVSLAFPIQNLMIGVATGTGVGVNALLSRNLGAKNYEEANKVAENGVLLAVVGYAIFLILGLFGSRFFFAVQTDVQEIVDLGTEYLTICCCFSFGIFLEIMFERLMQATGKTLFTLFTQGTGAIINIILDPILIFGYFGLPAMGIAGAAWATVIGQIIAMILGIVFNQRFNHEIKLTVKGFKADFKMIGKIYAIGVPSIVMVGIGSVMTFTMNKILISFTETAAAVFGVYFKIQSFVFMPIFGLNNGVIPIVSYNYGAQKRKRMMQTVKIAVMLALGIMLVGFLTLQLIPKQLLLLYNASPYMIEIGIPALRILSIPFMAAGFCIVLGSIFQALGRSIYSMMVSICRQLVVLIPAAYLLSLSRNLNLVWFAFPIAEIMSLTVTVILFIRIYNEQIRQIPE